METKRHCGVFRLLRGGPQVTTSPITQARRPAVGWRNLLMGVERKGGRSERSPGGHKRGQKDTSARMLSGTERTFSGVKQSREAPPPVTAWRRLQALVRPGLSPRSRGCCCLAALLPQASPQLPFPNPISLFSLLLAGSFLLVPSPHCHDIFGARLDRRCGSAAAPPPAAALVSVTSVCLLSVTVT